MVEFDDEFKNMFGEKFQVNIEFSEFFSSSISAKVIKVIFHTH